MPVYDCTIGLRKMILQHLVTQEATNNQQKPLPLPALNFYDEQVEHNEKKTGKQQPLPLPSW